MSKFRDWFNKRPQLKKPGFWVGALLMLTGGVWYYVFRNSDFSIKGLGILAVIASSQLFLQSRKPRG